MAKVSGDVFGRSDRRSRHISLMILIGPAGGPAHSFKINYGDKMQSGSASLTVRHISPESARDDCDCIYVIGSGGYTEQTSSLAEKNVTRITQATTVGHNELAVWHSGLAR